MLRFKQFLLEAPSVEDQLKTVNQAVADTKKVGVPAKGEPFPRVPVDTVIGPGVALNDVQVVGTAGEHPEGPGIRGEYHPDDKTVVVYGTKDPSNRPAVLTHEFVHADQDARQAASGNKVSGQNLKTSSPGIDPKGNYAGPAGADPDRPLAYPEYAYTDVEVNARAVTNAADAGKRYQEALDVGMRYIDKNDPQAVQNLKDKLRASILNDTVGNERQMSASNVKTVLNAEGPGITPESRSQAMAKVLDAGEKAERTTQEKVARGMAMVEPEGTQPQPKPAPKPASSTEQQPKPTNTGTGRMTGGEVDPQVQTMMNNTPTNAAEIGLALGGELPTQLRNKPEAAANSPFFSDEEQRNARARLQGLSSESGMEFNPNDPNAQRIAAQREKDRQREKASTPAQGPQMTPAPM
jgi:hypothetical protein